MSEASVPSRARRVAAVLCGLVMILALGIAILAGTFWFFGTNKMLLLSWMDWNSASESVPLSEKERVEIAGLVADTMAGRTDSFQYKDLFDPQAQSHMMDCVPLFRLARTVGLIGFGLFLASLGACLILRAGRETALGMLIGAGVLIAAALALGIWGLIDFGGLFEAFHRLLFTNEDWLFGGDNLLVILLPTGFFIRCAAVGGALWLASLLAAAAVAFLMIRKSRKKFQP